MVVTMRKVFVYKEDDNYKIIDKATNQVIDTLNDVLLFNAKYMRYKGNKGWHGILSEEMNLDIIKLLETIKEELIFQPKVYYPRVKLLPYMVVKTCGVLWLKSDGRIFNRHRILDPYTVEKYCQPYKEKKPLKIFNLDELNERITILEDEIEGLGWEPIEPEDQV